jgi:hypothetical protein
MRQIVTEEFITAVHDYFYLINRNYSGKSVLKLVGDRYHLDRIQRNLLYRGVVPKALAERRRSKLKTEISGEHISIDGYNVLLTISNYLLGRTVYISNDGLLRDAGEVFGKQQPLEVLHDVIDFTFPLLKKGGPRSLAVYFDSPVAFSGELAGYVRKQLEHVQLPGTVEAVHSPDYFLKKAEYGLVATSDSIIIDACTTAIVDLPLLVLSERFSPDFIRLDRLV